LYEDSIMKGVIRPVKRSSHRVARIYALFAAFLVLGYLPTFVFRSGVENVLPVALGTVPRQDGSMAGLVRAENRQAVVTGVSMNGGPWVPAGGLTVARELPFLPAGTPVSLQVGTATTGTREIAGRVEERPQAASRVAFALVFVAIGTTFALTGAALALAGINRLSLLAAAMLGGCGHYLAAYLLGPNAQAVPDPAWRNGVVLLWGAFPRYLCFFWLASFLSVFPTDLWSTRTSRVARLVLGTLGTFHVVVSTIGQLPGTFERLSTPLQVAYLTAHWRLSLVIFAAGFLFALVLLFLQSRAYGRRLVVGESRQRATVVGMAFLVGLGPAVVLALAQTLSLALRGKQTVSPLVMALSFIPSLLIPLALAYAILARRVDSVGILVRKAVLFGFAEKTARIGSLVPLAALAAYLWIHRQSRLDELLAAHPLPLVAAVGASVLALTTAERARAAVERLFFRRKGDAALTLRRLAEKARETRSVSELADLLTTETDRALGLDSAVLFLRDARSDSFSCEGQSLPSLEGASRIAEEVLRAGGPLDVAPDDPASALQGLPELERHWLEASRARLLVPLTSSDGNLLALLVLGEKRSELPFDREDEQLLAAAAASAGLALENQILRSSGASGDRTSHDATADYEPSEPRSEAGLLCRSCSRVFATGSGALCPDDDSPLEPAPVPHLLAAKYRFEKRIGAGGMGVVYRARDVSLARDVAIKVLPKVSHQAVRRLRREARAAARLIHPNLGLIFAAETWRGTPMLVLEFLDGGTLEDRIECGEIPVADVVEWGIRLAGALEAAHAQGLLHRDIKPSNIGFTTRGIPKLLDFGLVRLFDEPAGDEAPSGLASVLDPLDSAASGIVHLTASGRVVGTAPYLSPEAVQGRSPGPGFDVWGLTITLYEALTGRNPFAVAPFERTFNLILTTPLPDPRLVRADCPEPVATFFLGALSKSSLDRPATARELRERLEALAP
jgi:hypothetical protein